MTTAKNTPATVIPALRYRDARSFVIGEFNLEAQYGGRGNFAPECEMFRN